MCIRSAQIKAPIFVSVLEKRRALESAACLAIALPSCLFFEFRPRVRHFPKVDGAWMSYSTTGDRQIQRMSGLWGDDRWIYSELATSGEYTRMR